MLFSKRVTILVGHFGSGKTELAIQGVMSLVKSGVSPVLVDLDVVKPYFRSRGARHILEPAGIRLIAPAGENVYADLPIIVPQVRGVCANRKQYVVLDAGGDDTGVRVVGSIKDVLRDEETDVYLVLNFRRPFTPDAESAVAMARAIEASMHRKVTGTISNTHLLGETTEAIIREGYELARETSRRLGVELVAVAMEERFQDRLLAEELEAPLWFIQRIVRPPFGERPERRTTGPLFTVS